ncbi:TRAP transporter substrate-binding protein DctP [Psychrobacillus sp. OK032]|uniref:TRAP transporter substrate-binding protein DctP n=1 Tax=Psychrobacillus sp. OK032 TaxID=1884358 RepID=UPI0008C7825D|nr:TRAP transporter substrate-binding protein DctP [Psychrobacillus sp. OK032]SER69970.1 TRAP-type C4-dicarboxylate transport system, substrate-binding protein [Psychrobacillus sp. OK032]
MKKKFKKFGMIGLIIPTLLIAACNSEGSSASADSKKMIASSGLPAGHAWEVGFYDPVLETVTEQTDGKVTFEKYTSGELVTLGEEYNALQQGTIDVALSLLTPYDPKRFPLSEVSMLPVLESDAKMASIAMQNMMNSEEEIMDGKTFYELEFTDNKLVAFAVPITEPYLIATVGAKFDSLNDFTEKIRLRSSSRVHDILSANLGVTPLTMSVADSYDALSRNALDGVISNIPDWERYGFNDMIKYSITGANLGHFPSFMALTIETWESLPEETRDAFKKVADEKLVPGVDKQVNEGKVAFKNFTSNGGKVVSIEELNPEVSDYINIAMTKTWTDWIKNLEKNNLPGKKVALMWRDKLVEAGGKVPKEIEEMK